MIKYKLTCKSCNKYFDSWFSSSKEYDKLKKLKHLNCYNCGSIKIEKTLMTPSICNSKNETSTILRNKKNHKVKNKIREYQKFIKKNFDYVGDNFAYEARSLHYNDKKKIKGIYGQATPDEVLELSDEGIETDIIPWLNDNKN